MAIRRWQLPNAIRMKYEKNWLANFEIYQADGYKIISHNLSQRQRARKIIYNATESLGSNCLVCLSHKDWRDTSKTRCNLFVCQSVWVSVYGWFAAHCVPAPSFVWVWMLCATSKQLRQHCVFVVATRQGDEAETIRNEQRKKTGNAMLSLCQCALLHGAIVVDRFIGNTDSQPHLCAQLL